MSDNPIPEPRTLGWREFIDLPDLGLYDIKAKVDTGARSSSIHAFDIHVEELDGQRWVNFKVHPLQHDDSEVVQCRAPVKDSRQVTDSGGHRTQRLVIDTTFSLGGERFTAEVTLADRGNMLFRMLIGRTAMNGRYVVDPKRSYCVSHQPQIAD